MSKRQVEAKRAKARKKTASVRASKLPGRMEPGGMSYWDRESVKMLAAKQLRGILHDQVAGHLGSIERSLAWLADIQVMLASISAHLGRIADASTERLQAERDALEAVALKVEALKPPPPVVVKDGIASFVPGAVP